MSYAALRGFERTRLVSIAGAMNNVKPVLLVAAAMRMPAGALVIAAFDNDEGGDRLLDQVRNHLRDRDVIEYRPDERGQDWNDVLRETTRFR